VIALGLPVLAATLAALVTLGLYRRARPAVAALALTTVAAAAATASIALLASLSLLLLFHPHGVAWCERALGLGGHRALLPGLVAGATAVCIVGCAVRSTLRRRSAIAADREAHFPGGVRVLATREFIAYAQPGRPGHVVVSQGMLDALAPEEQLVVIAHERSHLRHHHHRYVAVVETCAAGIAPLRSLAAAVRFACERWADEDAARVVGERRLVARTVAVAALASADRPPLSLGGQPRGVPARVRALLAPPAPIGNTGWFVAMPAMIAFAAALVQMHGLGDVVQLLV